MMLEDCHYGCPSVESVLAPLRALIYRIVLPRTNTVVEEYGRTPAQEFQSTTVRLNFVHCDLYTAERYICNGNDKKQVPVQNCLHLD